MLRLTFGSLELFEHLDEADGADQVRVLGRGLDDDLQVLPNVDLEHLVEALERLLDREGAKVLDEPVRLEEVGVNHDALDVVDVLVVLEGPLGETGLFAELRDASLVVV